MGIHLNFDPTRSIAEALHKAVIVRSSSGFVLDPGFYFESHFVLDETRRFRPGGATEYRLARGMVSNMHWYCSACFTVFTAHGCQYGAVKLL
uniref:Uncharacterized protein n=1 Tax=Hyaloperonospora arabidopsidis (strain Emoy2) TaxID=559515 RepID=M4BLA9_HYAAE